MFQKYFLYRRLGRRLFDGGNALSCQLASVVGVNGDAANLKTFSPN